MNRQFFERLNQELDDMGVPKHLRERIEVFSKLMHIPKFKAEAILNGQVQQAMPVIDLISKELEVSRDWLLGQKVSKHKN